MEDFYDLRQLMVYFLETLHNTEMRWSQAVRELYDEIQSLNSGNTSTVRQRW